MKILFSSYHNPQFLTVTEYIENAITALGHKLYCSDDRNYILPGRIRQRLKWIQRRELKRINRKLINKAVRYKPDIAIIAGGHRISADTLKILKQRSILCALWTIDPPLDFKPILDVAQFYDHIFCQGTEAVEILRNAGHKNVDWLPVGCDPKYHKKVKLKTSEIRKYKKDIAFVGSYYPNRWKLLKELKEFNIGIWGPGWDKANDSNRSSMDIKTVHLNHNSWGKIYSAAKIIIIIHYQDGIIPCYQASPKIFEALACNSFVLVDKQKDVFSLFKDRTHLVGFNNDADLKEKISYYLINSEERERIASAGNSEALKKHLYIHRIRKLLETLKN
jgi:spore maturation protein CgeB